MNREELTGLLNENIRSTDRIGLIGEFTDYRKYSVAIPIVYRDNKLFVLLQVRAKHMKSQPGEISFPGGRIEEGEDSKTAAIRETCEELNINENSITILGSTDIMITQHNKIIYPYVIEIKNIDEIKPFSEEVDHVFYVPLNFFMRALPETRNIRIVTIPEEEFPYSDMVGAAEYKWLEGKSRVYFYRYDGYVIWGLTAKIMHDFVEKLKGI